MLGGREGREGFLGERAHISHWPQGHFFPPQPVGTGRELPPSPQVDWSLPTNPRPTHHDDGLRHLDGLEGAQERVEEAGQERQPLEAQGQHQDHREEGGGRHEEGWGRDVDVPLQVLQVRCVGGLGWECALMRGC